MNNYDKDTLNISHDLKKNLEIISHMNIFLYLPTKSPEKEKEYGNTTQGRSG